MPSAGMLQKWMQQMWGRMQRCWMPCWKTTAWEGRVHMMTLMTCRPVGGHLQQCEGTGLEGMAAHRCLGRGCWACGV